MHRKTKCFWKNADHWLFVLICLRPQLTRVLTGSGADYGNQTRRVYTESKGPAELNCELRTAHRKRLFVKQTYMCFMAATLLHFYFGLQWVDISTWLGPNFLCFSSPLKVDNLLLWQTHTASLPSPIKIPSFFALANFIFVEVWGPAIQRCFDRFRNFTAASRVAGGAWGPHLQSLHLSVPDSKKEQHSCRWIFSHSFPSLQHRHLGGPLKHTQKPWKVKEVWHLIL